MAISITGEVYGIIGPLVKGSWIFLTGRSEKDWGIPSLESPRHFVALSPLTRGVNRTEFSLLGIEIGTGLFYNNTALL